MSLLMCISIGVGILSGVWGFVSSYFGLITWVGFIGCTSYYAAGGKLKGLKKSVATNMTGVLWAMLIIITSNYLGFSLAGAIMTGIFSFVMCAQARFELLSFIPGTFCGSCSTFGSNGNWKGVIIALICGAFLGYSSEIGGIWLHKLVGKKAQMKNQSSNS
ncbi:DUF1097 domain-containing protein [Clostridium sporogenes]|nr:DUF1097 domain-containing protein [Clostridium sporogenes]NFS26021.1 DUF1097 domain-containing protein [Clostridium sporogenes]